MNNFEKAKQFKKELRSFKENPITPDDDFNKTHQYKIDFEFIDQLTKVIDDLNKEFPYARLTIDTIEGYNGKYFLVENKKMNLDKLKEYAKNLDEINRNVYNQKIREQDEKDREDRELDRRRWWDH